MSRLKTCFKEYVFISENWLEINGTVSRLQHVYVHFKLYFSTWFSKETCAIVYTLVSIHIYDRYENLYAKSKILIWIDLYIYK